jgi:nicotinamidase-related amidase
MSLRKTALLICDLQQKTTKQLFYKNSVINNVNKLLFMKQYIPEITFTTISEFIPEKLGITDNNINIDNVNMIYTKETYSMVNCKLINGLNKNNISDIILTGMEIQWCLSKTVEDLKKINYIVYVPVDAVGNHLSNEQNKYNFEHLKNNGALLTTTDAIICKYLNYHNDNASKKYVNHLKETKQNKTKQNKSLN